MMLVLLCIGAGKEEVIDVCVAVHSHRLEVFDMHRSLYPMARSNYLMARSHSHHLQTVAQCIYQ